MNYDKKHKTKFRCLLQDLSASHFSYKMYTSLAAYRMLSEVFYFMKYANKPEKTMRQFIIKVSPPIELL